MTEHPHILHAWHIEPNGRSEVVKHDKISALVKSNDLAWIHLDVLANESRSWIENEISYLDKIIIDALLARDTRPRYMEIGDGALLILRGVNKNENADPEDMISLRIWVDAHRIITLQRRPLRSIKDIAEKLSEGTGPKDPGEFLAMLCSRLFEYIDEALVQLSEEADDIEDAILDNADISYREKIVDIRRTAIVFRKFMAPQRDVINQLIFSEQSWITEQSKRRLRENYNQLTRYIEELDSIRERAQIVQDELTALLSDRLNKNLYVLSIVSAIFLPLGFLTGLMGINIGGMPGVENPNAFWIFTGALVALLIAQIAIFRWKRWF